MPAGANASGIVSATNSCGTAINSNFTVSATPALTALTSTSGLPGDLITLTGTNLTGATSVNFNGTAQTTISGNTATGLTVAVPAGATTGNVTVTTPNGTSNGLLFSILGDLVVSTAQSIQGSYRNVTVTGTGTATLSGPLVVRGAMVVQPNAALNIAANGISGSGSFALSRRATLTIVDVAGISASGATGAIQVTGTRTFSPDAYYIYNSAADQITGTGLPGRVARLTHLPTNAFLTRTNPVAVRGVLALHSNTTAAFLGGPITLLSDADTTAAVDYSTGGSYAGSYTVQRHIKADRFAGAAYRHLSAPVAGATVGSLAVPGGFQPTVNAAYNNAAAPTYVTPFPTVFGYDETRLATATNNLVAIDKGWASPAALITPLLAGRGYTVHLAANQTLRFVGTVRSGSVAVPLTRGAGPDAGWALVGNPFAAPFSLASLANTAGVDNAKYVFEASGPYAGTYRTYLPGSPTFGNPMVALGQGFFTRVSAPNTSATLTMNSANTTAGNPTVFHRAAADARPLLTLRLTTPAGTLTDETSLYLQAGIPAGVDGVFDAVKLPNPSGLNLAQVAAGQPLSINGLPMLTAATVVPLTVAVPAAGTYTLRAAQLRNLPASTSAVLVDALTGTRANLATLPAAGYAFTITAAQAATAGTGRFFLNLTPAAALATATPAFDAGLGLYPNPATSRVTVLVPAVVGATQVKATLFNALGQQVLTHISTLPAHGAALTLNVAGLARGVYTVRLAAGATATTRRLVLN